MLNSVAFKNRMLDQAIERLRQILLRSARPIEEVLNELAKEVPQDEWDRLPSDLNENLDHYLYGVPKK